MEPKSGWRNWGDHPIVVIISLIAALITIIVFLTGKSGLSGFFTPEATPTFSIFAPTNTFVPLLSITSTSAPAVSASNPTFGIGSTWISPKDGMVMVYVPAGNFLMGSVDSDPNARADEKPQHTVYLDAFWIDQTDVTNAMYAKCASAGACKLPASLSSNNESRYYLDTQFDNYPVINIDWNLAETYCKWAGRRLPTEAQWEKAARGTDGRTYPWGNYETNINLLNFNGALGDTTTVGQYPNGASIYGALDMAGDVWQWVADWYNDTYYHGSPSSNPLGPDSGQYRVLRGSAWSDNNYSIRSANRIWLIPTYSNFYIGFRCSRSQ